MRLKRIMALILAICMVLSSMGTVVFANSSVAKVGNTEYATIDEAIAAWTNNTTLTLLDDVTLSDVIKLSSTEYHILDLGTYTMTAASGKDAIQYVVNGRSSAGYALDIKADATNPGGITATGKTVVSHIKPSSGAPSKDRPITRFYGGVFNASYVVKQGGSGLFLPGAGYTGASAPYFQFYGGEYNGTIYTNRSQNQFHGGTFNGSMQMSVDSSAYTLVAGGTFKNLSNSMGSTLNSDKFTIGSSKGVNNGSVCVDENGNYVITTTTPADAEASVASNYNSNNYFYYSTVNTNGMYYEDVYDALETNKTGVVTVFADELDLSDTTFKGEIVVPEGEEITIIVEEGTTPAWTVSSDDGATVTYTDTEGNVLEQGDDNTFVPVGPAWEGEGTSEAPYLIEDVAGLIAFQTSVNSGEVYDNVYFKLANDIDLAASAFSTFSEGVTPNWEPIGTKDNPFKGTFDGDGKTISNLIVVGEANQGFIGYANEATIKNIKIENATVIGTDCVGAIAGQVYSSSLIDNCHVSGNIQITGQTNVGGIVGKYYTKVTNSSVIGDGTSTSFVKGEYYASDLEGDNVGGIMGHCGENNNLSVNTVKNITISGTRKVGGIVGIADQNTDVSGCVVDKVVIETTATKEYSEANITKMSIGGLIGQYQAAGSKVDGTVKNSTVSNVEFVIPEGVVCEAGVITGGARGGTNGMLPPSDKISAEGNTVTNVTGATNEYLQPVVTYVAEINGVGYETIEEAIKAAAPSGTVEIVDDVVVDEWIMISQRLSIASGQLITLDMDGLTINGNGHTLTVNSVESATNGDRLFHEANNLNINNLTINYADGVVGGISLKSGKLNNVTINGGVGVLPGDGNITITGCTFNTNGSAIYSEEVRDNLVVTSNTFNTAVGQYAIYLRGKTTFTNNTVVNGKVNVVSGSPVVTGNDFGNERFKVYNEATATIENNKINNLVFNDETVQQSAFSSNTLSETAQAALNAVSASDVAKIGDVTYKSIQAAVNAAQDGDVITVVADHELTWDGETVIDGSLAAYVCVAGKAVTIDLNGKKLTGDTDKMSATLYAAFAADEGGSITMKDSVGTGSVSVTGDNAAYCLLMGYESGTKLTVEGGTYYLENASSSLVYSGGSSDIVTVKGGNFTLGNVGTGANGSPWIFNAYQSNQNSVTVTGGTYNANIFNQYWRHEVQCAGKYAAKDNGNGTWTVVPAKACVAVVASGYDYLVGYETINEAIAAAKDGETVTIFAGKYEQNLNVDKAITVVGETGDNGYQLVEIIGKLNITADGATVKGLYVYNGDDNAAYISAKDVLVEGCEIASGKSAFRYCYTDGTVTFKDSVIAGSVYGIHFDGNAGGKIVIDNCKIQGWTSFASTINKVTISDSEFADAAYNVLRFYQDAEVTNTIFAPGMRIDAGNGGTGMEGIKLTFDNCSMADGSNFVDCFPGEVIEMSDVYVDDVQLNNVAKIGDKFFTSLEEALKAATADCTITLLDNITISDAWDCRYNGAKFTVPVTIDGNGKTLKLTGAIDDKNWNTVFRFESDATVKNLTIDVSEATGVQRGIAAMKSIVVDNCTLIGNGTSSKYAVIFGEGAGAAISDVTVGITKSKFINWSYGVSDNRNGQDAKSVEITGSEFNNANVLVSGFETVTFTGNKMAGGYVNISSYTVDNTCNVTARDNVLDLNAAKDNTISVGGTIDAQEGFIVPFDGTNINNLDDLKVFRDSVNAGNTYKGKIVLLNTDIDLGNEEWTPIGSDKNHAFQGTFDGQDHTISNLKIDNADLACAGLFGYASSAKINNVKINNVDIHAYSQVGAIAGTVYTGSVSNCHVSGTIKLIADYAYAGGITSEGYVTVSNCSVVADDMGEITVKESSMAGGITGWRGEGNTGIYNCTVKNLNITAWASVGAITGLVHYENTIDGCTVDKVNLYKTRVNGQASIGLAAGNWSNKADDNYTITITNNSFDNITIKGTAINSLRQLYGSNYSYYDKEIKLIESGNTYGNITTDLKVVAGSAGDLEKAFAYANDGETITLVDDFELTTTIKNTKNIILNLNGKTITGTDNATGSFALIEIQPGAELTINDTVGTGKITLTSTNNRGWNAYSSVISNQRGKLTVNGGTIEHLGGTDMAYGIDNLTNGKGTYAETVINDGIVKSPYRAIRQFLNGVEAQNILTMNGGTVEGANKSIWMQDANAYANPGTLTVKEDASLKGDVYLFVTEGSTEWPVQVSIAAAALEDGSTVVTGNVPEGYEVINENGYYGVQVVSYVAQIGDTKYKTLEDALAAAQNGDEIVILSELTISEETVVNKNITISGEVVNANSLLTIANGVTLSSENLKGNYYAEADATVTVNTPNAYFIAGGNLTFVGENIVSGFSAGYSNRIITINEGNSLKVTSSRLTVSYGNTFNIKGDIENAKEANKETITPSLELVGGISFTGNGNYGNGTAVSFNVENAYVKLGDSTTKNSDATGTFNVNFTNSIVDFTKTLKTYEPTATGKNPTINLNWKDSVVSTASHLELWRTATNLTLDNTDLTVGGSFANAGTIDVINGANFVVKAPIMSSHGGNTGTITIDGAVMELKDSNQNWENNGTFKVTADGKLITNDFASAGSIIIDAMDLAAGTSATVIENANGTSTSLEGKVTVENGENVTVTYGDTGSVTIEKDITYVAEVNGVQHATLHEAITAANPGDEIVLLDNVTENVTIDKNITLDGADKNYTGTMTISKSINLTIDDVNFIGGNIVKGKSTGTTGTYIITNCSFVGDSDNDGTGISTYAIEIRGSSSIVIEDCTCEDYFGLLQVPSSNNSISLKNVTIDGTSYAIKVDYSNGVSLENVTITNSTYGFINSNFGTKTIAVKNSTMKADYPLVIWDRNTKLVNTFKFEGNNDFGSNAFYYNTVTEDEMAYTKYVLTEGATLTAIEGLDVTTDLEDYVVKYTNGTYALVAVVAKIGDAKYTSLAEALEAAQSGDEIVLLADVTENVTIDKSITLDGADKQYTGTMTISDNKTVTIDNVNFVKGIINESKGAHGNLTITNCDFDGVDKSLGYAISVRGGDNVVIENSTAKNYSYGMLYIPSAVANISVKDVEVSDVTAGFNISYSGDGIFENVKISNVTYGLHVQNYGSRTFTLDGCEFDCDYPIFVQEKDTANVTFKFVGENNFGTEGFTVSDYAKLVLGEVDATLTAVEGLNITTDLEHYAVKYTNGTYALAAVPNVRVTVNEGVITATAVCESANKLFIATYKNEKLVSVEIIDTVAGLNKVDSTLSTSGVDEVKAFVFESIETLKPVCNADSVELD